MGISRHQKVNRVKLKVLNPIFHNFKFANEAAECPACHHFNSRIRLTLMGNSQQLTLLSCRKCKSLYYPNAKAPDYRVVENEASFYMRIDQAESIDSALLPLFSIPTLKNYSVIDVGCGLGFTSDFIKFQGRECLAFDPSTAAKISSHTLNVEISQEKADPRNTQTQNPNKLVFVSEVIEHVENPLEFLEDLRKIAGPTGYLIVTTPNAEYVRKGNSTSTIMVMLMPSQHLFLLSAGALENLARKAGFVWARSWTQDERLFLAAGPESQEISNYFSRATYTEYLKSRLLNHEIEEKIRYRSFGYRLFKDYVNSGRYVEASELWLQLKKVFGKMGFNLEVPTEIVEMYENVAGAENLLPEPREFPYNMAMILYFKGILLIAHNHDRVAARPYFDGAKRISELYSKVLEKDFFQVYDLELRNVSDWAQTQIKSHSL